MDCTKLVGLTQETYEKLYNKSKAQNQEIANSRLHPSAQLTHDVYLLIVIVKQNLVEIEAEVSAVKLTPFSNTQDAPQSQLRENLTISTKPEVHDVLRRHERTEPRRKILQIMASSNRQCEPQNFGEIRPQYT